MSQLDLFSSQPQAAEPEPLTEQERYWHKHMARVFIEQARAFALHPGYAATLLEWAASRRRKVQAGVA